jgi:L-ascorbate metabolism protein UlaG (beta-lactamase superfamily)
MRAPRARVCERLCRISAGKRGQMPCDSRVQGERANLGYLALIPIGAYAPRWFMKAQHTDPNEAVQIMEDLEAARAVGIHWGVFQLTDEPRDEPRELLVETVARRGIAEGLFSVGVPGLSYDAT